ncbi:MAG: hypothetical protein L0228_11585 [Planctomycetes bacterium]|nr:hypothetical protein [Planctomycetota bacterium]
MSNRRTTQKSGSAKRRPRRHLLIIYGALIVFGIALLIVGQSSMGRRSNVPPRDATPRQAENRETVADRSDGTTTNVLEPPTDRVTAIDDDGQTLWASPTDGPPIDVAYLSPGAQIVVVMRPKEIIEHPEGKKVIAALGPTGEDAISLAEKLTNVPLVDMQRFVVGWQALSDGKWQATLVVRADHVAVQNALANLTGVVEKKHSDQTYRVADDRAYYVPPHGDGKVLVVAPTNAVTDIIELAGAPPPLRRDVERLLAHTDADRDVTIVVTPNSLFSEGRGMFNGEMSRLREPLFWFLGDELSAAALSLHWDENFFFELIATPTLDTSPERAARILVERVGEIPDKLEAYVVGLDPQPYGRMVVARFPAMVRKLSAYTRSGFEPDHAVLRGYLPAIAGHNLLMGAELTLAERPVAARMVAEATEPSEAPDERPASIGEKLRRPTSLRFARDTLEAALEQLSQSIGVAIVIRGPDLQADGITKNQSFGIDLEDMLAEDVLIEILRLANPDKTASGPNDVKQKLVYVIGTGDDGKEQIFVTTRAAAASRGEELPAEFRAVNP